MYEQEAIRCLKHIHMANKVDDSDLAHDYLSRLADLFDCEYDTDFEGEVFYAILLVRPENLADVEQVLPVIQSKVSAVVA